MSQDCSRKSFLAKLGGMVLAAGFLPKLLGRKGAATPASPAPVALRPETRAVVRREETV